jgi:hypothetical protein
MKKGCSLILRRVGWMVLVFGMFGVLGLILGKFTMGLFEGSVVFIVAGVALIWIGGIKTSKRDRIVEQVPPARIITPKGTGAAPGQEMEADIRIESIRNARESELAGMLCSLDRRSGQEYISDKAAFSATCELIKEIGRKLDSQGGEELMKKVLVRAGALGCNTRFIEGEWDRIGTWMG